MAEKRFSAIFVCLKPDMAVLRRECIAAGKGRWYAGSIKEEWIMKDGKWVPWRVIAAIIGVLAIAYLWATKDVAGIYSAMPGEALVPYIVTNMSVTLAKVGLMAFAIWVVKRGAALISRKKEPR